MQKKYWLAAVILILAATIIKFTTTTKVPSINENTAKIKVVATFYPLADFAQNVGGQYTEVTNITPPGAEPHDFEPTPKDLARIYEADLFILNGQGVDVWAEKIIPQLQAKNITIIKMSDHVEKIKSPESDLDDPHFWLDPNLASTEANIIADALIQIDSTHAKEYNENRDTFKTKLQQLDQDYTSGLSTCKSRTIAISHDAFSYLAKRYNLTTFTLAGLSPDNEPSPKKIAEIITLARDYDITYIFFEAPADKKISETIASELGIGTLVLNPIEQLTDEEIKDGQNYISKMRANLQNLKTALICQ